MASPAPAVMAGEFAVLIVGATLLAFLARKTGQPTLIAYLATGILLGPIALDWVGETALVSLLSELGLAFLLFLIGIEMRFSEVRGILGPVVRIAIGQTIFQTALAFAVSYLLGFTLVETGILALATVFGATPVVVKLLADKDEISTVPGKIDIGVLLIQDVILIITLTVLSVGVAAGPLQVGVQLAEVLFLVGIIAAFSFLSSRYVLPRLFQEIVDNTHAFFVYGVAWAFVFISVAQYFDVSLEVGAFLAGLSLGQLPYSNQMQERIRPLTDLFMVFFFASIGLSLSAENMFVYWQEAVIASAVLMVGNFLIMFYLIDREHFTPETSFKGSINMVQVSEFSLVVGAAAIQQGFIGQDVLGYLSLMALITMGASSYLINSNDRIYRRVEHLLAWFDADHKEDISVETLEDHAVVVGYTHLAASIMPVLQDRFEQVVVVDRHPDNIGDLREADHQYIYGDFKHGEIRKAAKIKEADFIASFVPDHNISLRILQDRDEETIVFLETEDVEEAAELYDRGADYVMNRKILATTKLAGYLATYFDDRDAFRRETREDTETIWWRAHE